MNLLFAVLELLSSILFRVSQLELQNLFVVFSKTILF